jgi:uncharacterized protein YcbK (DUF882 family)
MQGRQDDNAPHGAPIDRRSFTRKLLGGGAMLAAGTAGVALPLGMASEALAAAGGTIRLPRSRGLWLYNKNTKESLRVWHVRQGFYDPTALRQLDWLLRDHHESRYIPMARKLYDVLYVLQLRFGSDRPVMVTSGYRTQRTNRMLAERIPGVASHSLHIVGQAVDFQIPERPPKYICGFLNDLGIGGVGRYPAHTHVDVGEVRHWNQS